MVSKNFRQAQKKVLTILDQSYFPISAVHRYQNGNDHFYTTELTEIGVANVGMVGNHGYKYEGPGFRVLANQEEGAVALYRYWNPEVIDHFYTTNLTEINVTDVGKVGNYGYKLEGVLGYCFSIPTVGTMPLHQYYNRELNDHFYTINFEELGSCSSGQKRQCSGPHADWHNARYEGIQCYVFPEQAVSSRIVVP